MVTVIKKIMCIDYESELPGWDGRGSSAIMSVAHSFICKMYDNVSSGGESDPYRPFREQSSTVKVMAEFHRLLYHL
jgi:hypothetical protein